MDEPGPGPEPSSGERRPSTRALLFGLEASVDRATYARWGFGLMAGKYLVDALVVWFAFGVVWTPLDYLNPLLAMRDAALGHPPQTWFQLAMGLWSLPFLWIGLSLTLRRLVDAGRSPAFAFLFFVPLFNYALMLTLCVLPSVSPVPGAERAAALAVRRTGVVLGTAIATLAVTVGLGLLAVAVLGEQLASYGWTLFVLVPFLLGAISAFSFNRPEVLGVRQTAGLVLMVLITLGASMLLFALEGAVCLLMVAPLAAPIAILGAAFGRQMAVVLERRTTPAPAVAPVLLGLLALPALGLLERRLLEPPVFEVVSALEVDAPPAAVWPHVVGFGELPEPAWLPFRLGIAYPVRAYLEGSGVGAVRRCEFSTGAFVEPITAWEPPHRLAFDVAAHPPPMHEWSPWKDLTPPHLADGFRSLRGEFRLTQLPGGGTRLEGSTWYRLRLFPSAYWRLWSDALVHRIHARVLDQIARETTAR